MAHDVVVTGIGVVSAAGDSPSQVYDALKDGTSLYRPVQGFETQSLADVRAIEMYGFDARTYLGDKNLRPLDRTGRLAVSAASLTIEDAGLSPEQIESLETGLTLGTMFCGLRTITEFDRGAVTRGPKYAKPMDFANTVINAASGQTALWHNLRGVNSTIASGNVSGLQAITYSADLVRGGRAQSLLAGGAEELCFESLYGFYRTGMLAAANTADLPVPYHANRSGFALGEGAAFLALESKTSAMQRGADIKAEILAGGTGFDPTHGQDAERTREILAGVIKNTLESGGIQPQDVQAVVTSANGSIREDRHEIQAIADVFSGHSINVTAPKSVLGETLGAGGPLGVVTLLEAMNRNHLPPVAGLDAPDSELSFPHINLAGANGPIRHGLITMLGYDGGVCVLLVRNGLAA